MLAVRGAAMTAETETETEAREAIQGWARDARDRMAMIDAWYDHWDAATIEQYCRNVEVDLRHIREWLAALSTPAKTMPPSSPDPLPLR